jgi:ribose/xylose/arabinose/galactoside ABC-type transport system permease subunit
MEVKRKENNQIFKKILNARETGILIPLVLISLFVGIKNPTFISIDNITNVLRNTSFTLIISVGMTFVLIAAGLDLSVGSILALGSLITGLSLTSGIPVIFSVLIGLAVGVAGGFINALIIVRLNIPPLITTLGTMYMGRGLVLILTKGTPIYPLPAAFNQIGQSELFYIPYIIIITLVLVVAGGFILNRTIFGRMIYAIGGNEETAKLSGINVNKLKISVYVIVGTLAALSGILMASRLGSSQPSIGDGMEMQVIASVIIGGTSMYGGSGSILGSVFGALFMNVLTNGMTLVGVSAYWQKFVMGAIIIVAVGIDQYKRHKNKA